MSSGHSHKFCQPWLAEVHVSGGLHRKNILQNTYNLIQMLWNYPYYWEINCATRDKKYINSSKKRYKCLIKKGQFVPTQLYHLVTQEPPHKMVVSVYKTKKKSLVLWLDCHLPSHLLSICLNICFSLPEGSTSLAIFRASEFAKSELAGETARTRQFSLETNSMTIPRICTSISAGWSPTGTLVIPGRSIRVKFNTEGKGRKFIHKLHMHWR